MERFLMDDLVGWKNSVRRKPLVLNGARQVGKTWLLMEFGARHFESVAYVNLDNNLGLASQFDVGYDLPRILLMIQAESGQRVIPGKTLVVLDEVQECPKALTSLKYFCENARSLLWWRRDPSWASRSTRARVTPSSRLTCSTSTL